jgi:sensor c-di-GMP phosphodiesterase-like protein
MIDDFGMGYSSLGYLERFPLDGLKIDIAFIRRIKDKDTNLPILKGIISIANELGLGIIAEGVENEMQADYLAANECFCAQGFHFYPPLHEKDFLALLESQT